MEDVEREECAIYAIALVSLAPVMVVAAMRGSIDAPIFLCLTGAAYALAGIIAIARRHVRGVRPPQARVVHNRRKR